MSYVYIILLILFIELTSAGNSLICRAAVNYTSIDPATFTSFRLLSGALTLWFVVRTKKCTSVVTGNWLSALTLFIYAIFFSFAYVKLTAATGTLLLFSSIYITIIGYGIWSGERLSKLQIFGLLVTFIGFVALLLPSYKPAELYASFFMIIAGVAWGFYYVLWKSIGDPIQVTAGNFLRTVPFVILLNILFLNKITPDLIGILYAVLSGSICTGLQYVAWYSIASQIKYSTAGVLQLSVTPVAALGGIIFLNEALTLHFVLTASTILAGIAMVIIKKKK